MTRPSVRFECQEGCGSYKTVFPGETPPACCGLPMQRALERPMEGSGERAGAAETAADPAPADGD